MDMHLKDASERDRQCLGPDPVWDTPRALCQSDHPLPFPIGSAFPPSLVDIRDFVAALAHELQVPLDLPAMLLVPIVCSAIAQKFEIEGRPGWREVAGIWTLNLLDSGERKSAVFRRMTDPIMEWERDEADRLAPDITANQERRQILEQQLLNARKKAGKGDAAARDRAVELAYQLASEKEVHPPTLLTSDTTSEALVELMIRNGERALVASPEADALDVLMGRYDDKGRPNMGVWLKGYSGDRVRVHRRGRAAEFLERPVLGVALTVQPEAVRGLFGSRVANGRGLLARFFPSVPPRMVGKRKVGAEPVQERLEMAYVTAVRKLLNIPLDAEMGPRIVRLSPDAAKMHLEFEVMIEKELDDKGFLADHRAWGAKFCGGILRIALALHVLEAFGGPSAGSAGSALEVSDETMKAALAWAPYLIAHERLACGIAGCDLDAAAAERVLNWLERTRCEQFSKRDCFTACRCHLIQKADDMDDGVALLEELGYIRPLVPPTRSSLGGRPPSTRYLVNPQWLGGLP